jgi:hypothetical protein
LIVPRGGAVALIGADVAQREAVSHSHVSDFLWDRVLEDPAGPPAVVRQQHLCGGNNPAIAGDHRHSADAAIASVA